MYIKLHFNSLLSFGFGLLEYTRGTTSGNFQNWTKTKSFLSFMDLIDGNNQNQIFGCNLEIFSNLNNLQVHVEKSTNQYSQLIIVQSSEC